MWLLYPQQGDNKRSDFLGSDGDMLVYTGMHVVLNHLCSQQVYYFSVLARNSASSGRYSETGSAVAP